MSNLQVKPATPNETENGHVHTDEAEMEEINGEVKDERKSSCDHGILTRNSSTRLTRSENVCEEDSFDSDINITTQYATNDDVISSLLTHTDDCKNDKKEKTDAIGAKADLIDIQDIDVCKEGQLYCCCSNPKNKQTEQPPFFKSNSRCTRMKSSISAYVKELFSPSLTHNNIKLLGCEKAVEEEKARSKEGYIIHPLSNFRQCWDLLIMLIMMFNIFALPLDIAFYIHAIERFLTLSDVVCMIDIILNFRTGYIKIPRDFELDGLKILKHYLRTWFLIDLLGSLPLQHIILGLSEKGDSVSLGLKGASHVLKYWKVLKLIRLLKLLRLSRIIRGILMYEEVYRITAGFMRYIKLIVMMMIIAHWNGCIQFMIPMLQGFPTDCWVVRCNVKDKEWYIQYGWAIFKTLSHMLCIGYGQFIPNLLSEASITIFTMVTGATFYALFIANSMAYMIETDYSKITYREKHKRAKEFLAYRHIPDDLRHRVDAYFNQKYSHGRYFEDEEVLSKVSKPIREDIVRFTCDDVIKNISIFKNASPHYISAILETVTSDIYLPGDIIVNEGRVCSELYFVRDGEIDITVNGTIIETLKKGSHFGEINVLVKGKCLFSAHAKTVCDVVILDNDFYAQAGEAAASVQVQLEHKAIIRILNIFEKCKLGRYLQDKQKQPDSHLNNSKDIEWMGILKSYHRVLNSLIDKMDTKTGKKKRTKTIPSLTVNAVCLESFQTLFTNLLDSHKKYHEMCNMSNHLQHHLEMKEEEVIELHDISMI